MYEARESHVGAVAEWGLPYDAPAAGGCGGSGPRCASWAAEKGVDVVGCVGNGRGSREMEHAGLNSIVGRRDPTEPAAEAQEKIEDACGVVSPHGALIGNEEAEDRKGGSVGPVGWATVLGIEPFGGLKCMGREYVPAGGGYSVPLAKVW
jgi:hypothetical protein